MAGNILVPVDGSENSDRAVKFAIDMLKDGGGKLHRLASLPGAVDHAAADRSPAARVVRALRRVGTSRLPRLVVAARRTGQGEQFRRS